MKNKLKPTIGLEVHIELKTRSKMFCSCSAEHFSVKANSHTCPVCLGLPGALPVPNKKAVEWTMLFGKALGCKINLFSKFDRKHYFYPDLPKGYQISQYDIPFCEGGSVEVDGKRVNITRVHLEEDTGKLQHRKVKGKDVSLVDFNRSGVPLMEIVTEPDIQSGEHAKSFAKNLRRVARYLEISDCEMEKGSMRLEANVSLGKDLGYKVEVKNLNSFNFLKKAIDHELKRQKILLEKGETPRQETRGWNESKNVTVSQRFKETSADYRYFPEPDIPPIRFSESDIENIIKDSPKLPQYYEHKLKEKAVSDQFVDILVENKSLAIFTLQEIREAEKVGLKANKIAEELVHLRSDPKNLKKGITVKKLLKKKSNVISDSSELEVLVDRAIKQNSKAVEDYKAGKKEAISALMGSVMGMSKGTADAKKTIDLLKRKLD